MCQLFIPMYFGDAVYLLLGRLFFIVWRYGDKVDRVSVLILNVNFRHIIVFALRLYRAFGIINDFAFAEDHARAALSEFNLTTVDLSDSYKYSVGPYVALHLCRSRYMVYNTGDVINAEKSCEWITRAITRLSENDSVVTACPVWNHNLAEARDECHILHADYGLGYGFSDQLFLCKPDVFRSLSQHEYHPSSIRYPVYVQNGFERRIDSVMRKESLLRYVDFQSNYVHQSFPAGWKRRLLTILTFTRLNR